MHQGESKQVTETGKRAGANGGALGGGLPLLILVQMLPATLVVPAIRPLFAAQHGGAEGPMHAFMSLNMVGAVLAVPLVGRIVDRMRNPRMLFAALAAIDGVILALLALPMPTAITLGLRTLEGAAHVGAATVLLSEASARSRRLGTGRSMGLAGAAIIGAIVLGSALGGVLVAQDFRAPFVVAGLLALVAAYVGRRGAGEPTAARESQRSWFGMLRKRPELVPPVVAAFVARFAVGCVVVTFALFAHNVHGFSDAAVGGLFALMTLPFAAATYPAARLSEVTGTAPLLGIGIASCALAMAGIGYVERGVIPVMLLLFGCGSALVFATVLCIASQAATATTRGQTMAMVNGAGCLGMLLGPPAAGIVASVFRDSTNMAAGYRASFLLAAGAFALWCVLSSRWLVERFRRERAGELTTGLSPATVQGSR